MTLYKNLSHSIREQEHWGIFASMSLFIALSCLDSDQSDHELWVWLTDWGHSRFPGSFSLHRVDRHIHIRFLVLHMKQNEIVLSRCFLSTVYYPFCDVSLVCTDADSTSDALDLTDMAYKKLMPRWFTTSVRLGVIVSPWGSRRRWVDYQWMVHYLSSIQSASEGILTFKSGGIVGNLDCFFTGSCII